MTFQRPLHSKCIAGLLVLLLAGCGGSASKKPAPAPAAETGAATTAGATQVDPQAVKAFDKAQTALMNGNRKKAEELFLAMTRDYPDVPGAFANLGFLLSMKDDQENAVIALKRAIELDPNNPEAYNLLGVLYRKSGRFQEALEVYQRGLAVAPKHKNLLRNSGILLDVYLDMPKQALEHYTRYRELEPDDKEVEIWSAGVARRVGS